MGLLFYTIGFPCAGKSTLARGLSHWLGASHLQADRVGRSLFVIPTFSPAERLAVYQHMDYQAMTALNASQTVLYDGTITSLEQRHHLRQLAAQYDTKAVGLWLDLPVEVARHRATVLSSDEQNGRVIQPEIFDHYIQTFQPPEADEPILKVDGQLPFGLQYKQLRQQLHAQGLADLPRLIQL